MPRQRDYAAAVSGALHFFLDDYRFETAWSSPERLLPRVQAVGAALTPDFSIWTDMPRAAQIWNIYRSRWCGAYWQSNGIEVIPTACWGTPDTYDFCFDGIPDFATVAISSMGIGADKQAQRLFRDGVIELLARKKPRRLLAYGRLKYCDDLDLPDVKEYPTFWDRRRGQVEWAAEERALARTETDEDDLARDPSPSVTCPQQDHPKVVQLDPVEDPRELHQPVPVG